MKTREALSQEDILFLKEQKSDYTGVKILSSVMFGAVAILAVISPAPLAILLFGLVPWALFTLLVSVPELEKNAQLNTDINEGFKEIWTGGISQKEEFQTKYNTSYHITVNDTVFDIDLTNYVHLTQGDIVTLYFAPKSKCLIKLEIPKT